MNDQNSNDQASCGTATDEASEQALEQAIESILDGNEVPETNDGEMNDDAADEDTDTDTDAGGEDASLEDPCAEVGGCGGGGAVQAPEGDESADALPKSSGSCGSGTCGG